MSGAAGEVDPEEGATGQDAEPETPAAEREPGADRDGESDSAGDARNGGSGDADGRLTQAAAFDLLSCKRRRDALRFLRRGDGETELRPLSQQIAAWENDVPVEDVTYRERARVYTALRQVHLPKMDDAGVVAFDRDEGTVTLTDRASELAAYLDVEPHDTVPWSAYYAALGALSLALAVLAAVGTFPFGRLPAGTGALAVALGVTAAAAAHRTHVSKIRADGKPESPGR